MFDSLSSQPVLFIHVVDDVHKHLLYSKKCFNSYPRVRIRVWQGDAPGYRYMELGAQPEVCRDQ